MTRYSRNDCPSHTLALALQKHGCSDVVLVDAQLNGENSSRALAVHAATVEVRYKALDTISFELITLSSRPLTP